MASFTGFRSVSPHFSLYQRPWSSAKLVTANYTPRPVMERNGIKAQQDAKLRLLQTVLETNRGLSASSEIRAHIEEAMVTVENYDAGMALDLNHLDGTWLLQYTTARDVISILQAAELPFFQVGQIFQTFEHKKDSNEGVVYNIVKWSIPAVLQEFEGATLTVRAAFSLVKPRTIQLNFQQACIGKLAISDNFQALLAPAVLPRSYINLQILQFFRSLDLEVNLKTSEVAPKRVSSNLLYNLTYLDSDMLLGRALGNGGVFIFKRHWVSG